MSDAALEESLGYRFRNPEMLRAALTHKSYAFERGAPAHNERLEFLGDSVLAAIVAHALYEEHPEEDEGRLSKRKAALVSRATLSRWGADMGLGKHLWLGSGEESTGGRERPSLLSNAMEAVIGAIYLDGGFEAARTFVSGRLLRASRSSDPLGEADFKSRLQEIVQKRYKVTPDYRLLKASGPDHERVFSVRVQLGGRVLGTGKGKSKKEAEQAAAKDALSRLSQ